MTLQDVVTAFLAVLGVYLAVVLVLLVLTIAAWWRLFRKAGRAGWRAVIPVLNIHTLYQICWKPVWFWLSVFFAAAASMCGYALDLQQPQTALALATLALIVASGVIHIIMNFKLARAFGHGVLFGIGLVFFHTLFIMILAFGASSYVSAARANAPEA